VSSTLLIKLQKANRGPSEKSFEQRKGKENSLPLWKASDSYQANLHLHPLFYHQEEEEEEK